MVSILTMNKPDLLSVLISRQLEDGSGDGLDPATVLRSLQSGQPVAVRIKKLLLKSPVARLKLREAIELQNLELNRRAEELHVDLRIAPLAAASEEQMVTINANGWKLIIFKEELSYTSYSLTLQLGDQLKSIAPRHVEVADSGGVLWIAGKPDSRAELTAEWAHGDFTPMDRLSEHSLQLELMSV